MTKEPQGDVHFRILRILEQRPSISQRELAHEVGIALGKANFLLSALAEKGLIKVRRFQAASDKRKYAYILTPVGISAKAELMAGFLRRKMSEYDALRTEIEGLQNELAQEQDAARLRQKQQR